MVKGRKYYDFFPHLKEDGGLKRLSMVGEWDTWNREKPQSSCLSISILPPFSAAKQGLPPSKRHLAKQTRRGEVFVCLGNAREVCGRIVERLVKVAKGKG